MKNLLELRPCQFVLGMREVQDKVKKIKRMTPKQRKKYINAHRVPVAKYNGKFYIIDHHHFVRACWETGIKKVEIEVAINYDNNLIKRSTFWGCMKTLGYVYLTDQFGRGNNDPRLLPLDIRGMSDDPYRGLAWAAREAGGFEKINVPFSEFKWANFLRKRIDLDDIRDNFKITLKKTVKLCQSKDACNLPGYKR